MISVDFQLTKQYKRREYREQVGNGPDPTRWQGRWHRRYDRGVDKRDTPPPYYHRVVTRRPQGDERHHRASKCASLPMSGIQGRSRCNGTGARHQ